MLLKEKNYMLYGIIGVFIQLSLGIFLFSIVPWGMYLAVVIFAIVVIAIMISEEVEITVNRAMFMLLGAAIMAAVMAPFFTGVIICQLMFSAIVFDSIAAVIFFLLFLLRSFKENAV